MFKEIKGGTKVQIMDAFGVPFDCWVPPIGYGYNPDMGIMEKTDIIKRSHKKEDQYWEREDLPSWWDKKWEQEQIAQETDPDFFDAECERVREKHWRRRLYGVWFYNNGVATYITGLHWFTLNWWKFQGKWFDFRIPNMEFYYMLDYCIEDPNCLGDIEITKRKEGKTARAGSFIYEYISRTEAKHGGLQSKTDPDAAEVFEKAIVTPWRKLPPFFRPIFDTSGGDAPSKELRFYKPSRKGRRKKIQTADTDEKALESFIDFESRKVLAYDGPELHRYVSDESGKLIDVSIVDRHNVVQFCSEVDGVFVGKQHYTTTVEEMESGGSEFKRLVQMSDRRELDENGRTKTGLYVYFLPAYRTLYYDRYGFPDEERGKKYYMNRRASLQSSPRDLSSFIRKNPFTLAEAFRVDGDKSLFNPENLNYQRDYLSWHTDIVERGNFAWKNGERFSEVEWRPNKMGRWYIPKGFSLENPNKVRKNGDRYAPENTLLFRASMDPFKYNKTKDNRRSDCASFVGKMYDAANPNDQWGDMAVCRYRHRAATTALANEDMLMQCWYFGCQLLPESNVDHWKAHFVSAGCQSFLMTLPGETEPGIYSDGHGGMLQSICDYIEDYVENFYKKILFIGTIDDLLEFDVGDTTKSDETIAFGILRIAMKRKTYRKPSEAGHEVTDYFKMYKLNAV